MNDKASLKKSGPQGASLRPVRLQRRRGPDKEEEYSNEYFNSFAEGQVDAMNGKVDHLTGLKDIISFQEELENSFAASRASVCTVVVFDIIGLQRINRSAGRSEGDRRIRSLVQTIYDHMPKDGE